MISEYLEAEPARRLALFIKNKALLPIILNDDVVLDGHIINKHVFIEDKKEILFAVYFGLNGDETAYLVCILRPKSKSTKRRWNKFFSLNYYGIRENPEYAVMLVPDFIRLILRYNICFEISYNKYFEIELVNLPVLLNGFLVGRGQENYFEKILIDSVSCRSRSPPQKYLRNL